MTMSATFQLKMSSPLSWKPVVSVKALLMMEGILVMRMAYLDVDPFLL